MTPLVIHNIFQHVFMWYPMARWTPVDPLLSCSPSPLHTSLPFPIDCFHLISPLYLNPVDPLPPFLNPTWSTNDLHPHPATTLPHFRFSDYFWLSPSSQHNSHHFTLNIVFPYPVLPHPSCPYSLPPIFAFLKTIYGRFFAHISVSFYICTYIINTLLIMNTVITT